MYSFRDQAVTICNMNQALKSAVDGMPRHSEEYVVLQSICQNSIDDNVTNAGLAGRWSVFRKVLQNVRQLKMFILKSEQLNLMSKYICNGRCHSHVMVSMACLSPVDSVALNITARNYFLVY